MYKIGACDWSIGKRQQIDAFEVAKEIGLDGIEVSFDGDKVSRIEVYFGWDRQD